MPRRPSTFCSPSWDPAATTTRKRKRKKDVDEQVHSSNLETGEHVVRMLWKKRMMQGGQITSKPTLFGPPTPHWKSSAALGTEYCCGVCWATSR